MVHRISSPKVLVLSLDDETRAFVGLILYAEALLGKFLLKSGGVSGFKIETREGLNLVSETH